jgi:hypothetical protein
MREPQKSSIQDEAAVHYACRIVPQSPILFAFLTTDTKILA